MKRSNITSIGLPIIALVFGVVSLVGYFGNKGLEKPIGVLILGIFFGAYVIWSLAVGLLRR
jgi:hypothetical protein